MSTTGELILTAREDHLPAGWSLATIEELVGHDGLFVDGDWVESKDQDQNGDVRLIQLADIGEGQYRDKSERFLTRERALKLGCTFLEKGDVLIARMPDPLGRACIYPGDPKPAVTAVDVAVVRSSRDSFNHRWLMYFVNAPAFRAAIASLQSGSTRKRISRGNLARIGLPVPTRRQQNSIAAEIDKKFSRLDEAVSSLKRVKANLKRYKAAVLKAAVEGKLFPIENRRTSKIGEIAELVTKGSSPNWQGFDYTQTGIVFVRSQNVGWGKLDLSDVAHLPSAFNEKERKSVLKTGDVLLNIVGASIGRAAVATSEIEGGNVNQAVAVIRLDRKSTLPNFLMLHLLSPEAQAAIHAEKVDVARANISLSGIKDFPVLLPSLAEQQHIVAEVERRLSIIAELEAAADANLKRADRLRQSILNRAFTGAFTTTRPHVLMGNPR